MNSPGTAQDLAEVPVALVTGAGGGLGSALVQTLADDGWRVVAAGHSREPAMSHPAVWPCRLDVTRAVEAEARVAELLGRWGRLDALIHTAGIVRDAPLARLSVEDWDAVMDVHLKGAFVCARAALGALRVRGGHVVNISSHAARRGPVGQANYAAAKAALVGFTLSLAREWAPHEIRVNALLPGVLPTAMTAALAPETLASLRSANALGRLNRPEEVAGFVRDLLRTRDVSGQVFTLDSRILRWA